MNVRHFLWKYSLLPTAINLSPWCVAIINGTDISELSTALGLFTNTLFQGLNDLLGVDLELGDEQKARFPSSTSQISCRFRTDTVSFVLPLLPFDDVQHILRYSIWARR